MNSDIKEQFHAAFFQTWIPAQIGEPSKLFQYQIVSHEIVIFFHISWHVIEFSVISVDFESVKIGTCAHLKTSHTDCATNVLNHKITVLESQHEKHDWNIVAWWHW